MKSKLILVEGIPGVGKSTTLSFISDFMNMMGIPNQFFYEGDIDHPADYEGVACLNESDYISLRSRYNINEDILSENVTRKGESFFISYRKLKKDGGDSLSEELFRELSLHDVYFLPLDDYSRLFREKWGEFVARSKSKDTVTVFECSFFQNPLTMLVRHNADEKYIKEFYRQLTTIISEMDPIVILMLQEDVRGTFEKVSAERPREWLDFVIRYVTRQEYGREHRLEGFAGMVEFYKVLRNLELKIFQSLRFDKLYLPNPHLDYDNSRRSIETFLRTKF
ncbi:MAG: hypothetical protein ACOCXC_05440, partial [Fibrobacterota bacterium]